MSTRSRIGIQLADDSILSVYCHYDGYPEFNGVKLIENFNSYEKAAELIDNGDVSCLWTDKDWDGNKWSDCKYQVLTYKMRGEDCPPRLDATLGKYLADGEEYAYLFANGEWVCYDTRDWRDTYKQKIEIKTPVAA